VTSPRTGPDRGSRNVDDALDAVLEAVDRPEVVTLLTDLTDADVMVVLSTDNIAEAQEILATRYLDRGLATALVNTALVGLCPPEDGFYQLCREVADVEPERILFVDCDPATIAGARRAGMRTILVDPLDEAAVSAAVTAIRDSIGW
jgi:HAD superfamily hydrolase (TIGR01509 family)